MGKTVVYILTLLLVFLLGLGGVYLYKTSKSVSRVEVVSQDNLQMLLADTGWNSNKQIKLFDRSVVDLKNIKGIKVEYSDEIQPFLQQSDGQRYIFASVNTELDGDFVKITTHVDPVKLSTSTDKNWWITHQVIRALNKMANFELTDQMLIEKDLEMFDKYKGKIEVFELNL